MRSIINELWHGNIVPQEDSRNNTNEMKEQLDYMSRQGAWTRRKENAAEPVQMVQDHHCQDSRAAGVLRRCYQFQDLFIVLPQQETH